MNSIRTLRSRIFQKETAPSFVLVLNSFVWYVLVYFALSNMITLNSFKNQSLSLFAAYFIGITVAAIAGSKVSVRSRGNLLKIWVFLGAIATFLLALVSPSAPIFNGLVIAFLGASIGLGLPSCLSYFAKQAAIEKRGLISGAIWGGVAFCVLILGILTNTLGAIDLILILGAWRLIGGVIFFFLDRKPVVAEVQKIPSYLSILHKRETLLFLLPWVMFLVINFTEKPILQHFFGATQYSFVEAAEFVFIGIFAFIGGLVADIGGRKRVVIAGFVMLGFEYATLSVFSSSTNTVLVSYIFMVLDGITWGLLFSVFFTVVWGDLGEHYEKEKFYVLGGVPLLLTTFLSVLITPYAASIPIGTAFTVASFFLFVAVIPLMYAPETLPEKAMHERDLKGYVEKALKQVDKETGKSNKKDKAKNEKENKTEKDEAEEPPGYEEARKLAEKYY